MREGGVGAAAVTAGAGTASARGFADPGRLVEGWYWLVPSHALRRGRARAVSFMGRPLAVYRTDDGTVVALDAHCPHMGAHLADGRVEGVTLRCPFHGWRFDADGRCAEVPSLGGRPRPSARVRSWPVAERHGLVWLWAGAAPPPPLPEVPELAGRPARARLANAFVKRCHPHVVLVNAIDEHHFNTVHDLPVRLRMEPVPVDARTLRVDNVAPVERGSWRGRLLARAYRRALTYSLTYTTGSVGTVTLGPDRLHFHVMFALRPTPEGTTEGWTVLLTRRRAGPVGWLADRVLLALTRLVAAYFARGDTVIFDRIRFDLRTPVPADRAVLAFVEHLERQPAAVWDAGAPACGAADA
jgi:phenylpropionate dioxygenase-like ring-hydroxylating dioxygenase large terminal subunit